MVRHPTAISPPLQALHRLHRQCRPKNPDLEHGMVEGWKTGRMNGSNPVNPEKSCSSCQKNSPFNYEIRQKREKTAKNSLFNYESPKLPEWIQSCKSCNPVKNGCSAVPFKME
jgi:hypothetical protein